MGIIKPSAEFMAQLMGGKVRLVPQPGQAVVGQAARPHKLTHGLVIPRISQEEFDTIQGCQFIDESFGGSLPNFLTAFTRKRKLSSAEIPKLQLLIQECEEEP